MTLGQALILYFAGLAAGFVNTVAGGGSAITVPILVEMVGATIANGTNRVAVLLANITAGVSFGKGGAVDWRAISRLLPSIMVGAVLGALVAANTPVEWMRAAFGLVLLVVAGSVLLKPSRWLTETDQRLSGPWRHTVFFSSASMVASSRWA